MRATQLAGWHGGNRKQDRCRYPLRICSFSTKPSKARSTRRYRRSFTTMRSWISTSAMINHAGASVVFADTDDSTFTIDPAAIEAAITRRTVGIIPVHLYGQPAEMDAIMAIAAKHKLWVVEDCAPD